MRLVIISGRSGSGKSTALHQLEDLGFYCIDNLPAGLLPALVEQARSNDGSGSVGTAVCIDARNAWKDLQHFPALLKQLPADLSTDIVYLDAEEEALIKRFSETRRRHPLSNEHAPLAESIRREEEILEPIAHAATVVMDTTAMSIHDLRAEIRERVTGGGADCSILFQSFGFKSGLPRDADLVFDMRVLPNPHWDRALRSKTGRDPEVARFLEQQPLTAEMLSDLCSYLDRWLPRYMEGSRSYITVSLGCTGGQHRSVYLAERLYEHYRDRFPKVHLRHRELQA
jgi:UPF0042 nucleotide-binding protein